MRMQAAERYQVEFQPTEESIRVMHDVLESNPYWSTLRSWADDPTVRTARLVLRWPGTTPGVRAFTYQPNVGTPGPRTIYVTRVDEDKPCRVRADDPRYALLSWPMLFPNGRELLRRPAGPPALWPPHNTWRPFEDLLAYVELSDEARKPRAFCRPVDLDTVPRDGCTRFARRGNPLSGGGRTLSLRGFISLRSNPLRFARRGNPLGGGCLALSLHSLLEHRRLDSLPLGKGWHVGVELRERRRWLRDGSRGHAMQARHRHPE